MQKAYGVLSDRKKKKVYDMMGEDGLRELEVRTPRRGPREPSSTSPPPPHCS